MRSLRRLYITGEVGRRRTLSRFCSEDVGVKEETFPTPYRLFGHSDRPFLLPPFHSAQKTGSHTVGDMEDPSQGSPVQRHFYPWIPMETDVEMGWRTDVIEHPNPDRSEGPSEFRPNTTGTPPLLPKTGPTRRNQPDIQDPQPPTGSQGPNPTCQVDPSD